MGYDYRKHFGEITLTQDLTTLPEERTWRLAAPEKEPQPHQIVLYLGCNVLRTSHMVRTVTAIFDRLGLDYIAVGGPTYCCGIVQHRTGDAKASEDINLRTIEYFECYSPREIVMWCPSCIYFYDEVKQRKMPVPSRHAAEFLASKLPEIAFTHRVDARVALHSHAQNEARRREGAAGRALGIEFEDRFKTYRLWEDPERVLAESAAYQQANGIDPDRARALVTSIFPSRSTLSPPPSSAVS